MLTLLAWALICSWAATGSAAPPEREAEGESGTSAQRQPPASSPEGEELDERAVARISERAQQITDLIAGELDPGVDVAELFTVSLVDAELGSGGDELRGLLASIHATRVATLERAKQQAEAAARKANKANKAKRQLEDAEDVELPPPPAVAGPEADPLTRARSELALAYWTFLTLPAERREQVLAEHRERKAKIASQREADARARARLEQLSAEARQLSELIAGELDVSVDPAPLLRVDLSAVDGFVADARLARALAGDAAPEPSEAGPDEIPSGGESGPQVEPSETEAEAQPAAEGQAPGPEGLDAELVAELAAAEAALDTQRLRFLALSGDEREAVLERHAERQREAKTLAAAAEQLEADAEIVTQVEEELTEAEDKAAMAKREREQAEAAAVQARSEALRRIAEERARLLGVKEAHALYEVEVARRKKDTLAAHEIALEWDRKVAELAAALPSSAREGEADGMYTDLRAALAHARDGLRETLTTIAANETGVEPVGEPLAGLPQDVDRSDLSALRTELEQSEATLRELEREVVWAAADSGRDDIVMLNRARLTLLDLSSDELRKRMTGFGSDGVEQVKREIDQIGLELRYRVLALPRIGRGLIERLESSPLPLVFATLKLAFLLLLFRYWRKRAEATLARIRDGFLSRERGDRRINSLIALSVWYVERIRRPVELLLMLGVVFRVVLADADVLELEIVWLVILWLLVGSTVILLVDAVAAHESLVHGRGTTATAQLRIRSLRLVGLAVVLTGLVLSLTEETVGQGGIHKWVRSLVWLAAIPILLVLIRWWREHAFRRIQDDPEIPDNALVRWIRANTEGWASFPAAAIAGGYLFVRGLARWLLRRATALETTRRLLAWMFRREVARQANARREDEQPVVPLHADDYAKFDPGMIPDVESLSPAMAAIAADKLDEIITLKVRHRGTLSAVIGERGSGKTTFLCRLARALEAEAENYEHDGHEAEKASAASGERHEEFGRLTVRQIQCPPGGFRQLQRAIAESVGLPRSTPPDDIVTALSKQTPLVFLIDDAHRLVRPAIGGLEGLDRFADFAREVSGDASWIASIGTAAWQYVSRARGDRVFFDQVVTLPRWNEQQIGELIRERSAAAQITPNFDEIVIPRQFDVATVGDSLEVGLQVSEQQRAEMGFYRILWDHAKGNPAVALHFWRKSLFVVPSAEGAEKTMVRLFQEPAAADLDEVGPTLHFVLRGVVQLGVASPSDLVACTQLPPADVADALRFALARGWVDRVGVQADRYRVTWHWYRAITDMLRRQHLLGI
ncbi:hypothetical protein ENSA5_00210 [Enhygromyxa salina]|uniref:AAA+ ATPase domain-containing protein n=1 Tax=Enhygromyxa salina TaxID=215803 RepID=A0A2S9YLC9_9BACT|nr:AAA family ATPase [Enhygromyxa salina]PRQ05909.1 hypothetical protein ENSA5_00210 [Enhygromyxa salina]